MSTTYPQSALPSRPFGSSELKAALLEPFLILGVSAFWIVTLPFAAVALLCVKIWDALSGPRMTSNAASFCTFVSLETSEGACAGLSVREDIKF